MSILQAINAHALAAAQSSDWEAVAATLRTLTETAPSRRCSSAETVSALQQAGLNPTAVLATLEADANGRFLLTMLASQGVIWNHPLTVPYIQGVLSAQVVSILRNLSAPVTALYPSVTAAECQSAWDAEVRTQRNATLRSRFDAILNQLDTSEHAESIAALRAMANELEA